MIRGVTCRHQFPDDAHPPPSVPDGLSLTQQHLSESRGRDSVALPCIHHGEVFMTITTDTTLLHDPRRQAALLYWRGFSVPQIAAMLQMKRPTVQSWKQRDGWDSVDPISRVEISLEARLTQLIIKPQKTGGDFKEIDLLGRQIRTTGAGQPLQWGRQRGRL
ncbi:helix-turn-helix domain-containing protein [Escherichia coli]|nr:helix-turn-helix domain-containing protein [Escherichia coli]